MAFSLYNAKIKLAGKTSMIIYKEALTAPQILTLRRIHGAGSVIDVEPLKPERMTRRQKIRAGHSDAQELKFLLEEYAAHVISGAPEGTNVVTLIWPGLSAVLPKTVEELPAETVEDPFAAAADQPLEMEMGQDLDAPAGLEDGSAVLKGLGDSRSTALARPDIKPKSRWVIDDLDAPPA